mmetsp:Transcript_6412/g.19965  ORF Transcript_6412/g.19965 Transcript_6412/m.19965 type:complete len:239 (+) Transcript_6412:48-764(+)
MQPEARMTPRLKARAPHILQLLGRSGAALPFDALHHRQSLQTPGLHTLDLLDPQVIVGDEAALAVRHLPARRCVPGEPRAVRDARVRGERVQEAEVLRDEPLACLLRVPEREARGGRRAPAPGPGPLVLHGLQEEGPSREDAGAHVDPQEGVVRALGSLDASTTRVGVHLHAHAGCGPEAARSVSHLPVCVGGREQRRAPVPGRQAGKGHCAECEGRGGSTEMRLPRPPGPRGDASQD